MDLRSRPTLFSAIHRKPVTVFRLALPHVALISISILYLIFGAATYAYLDRQYHASTHGELERSIDRAKSRFVDEMAINKRNETASVITFDNYMHYLNDVYKEHECYLQQHDDDQTFSGNLFMILTALTSIGYGEAAPCHSMGRGFMMGYIALGLPLMLVTIADSAKFASEVLLWLYLSYRRLYTRYFEQKLRDTKTKKLRQRKSVVEIVAQHAEMLARAQFGDDWVNSGIPPTATKEEIAEFIWQNLEKTEFVEVPVLLVLGVIVSYAGLGALMFHYTEGWTVTESLYFCIVSILTIGFGDFVPHNSSYITLATIYVLIGLVITTMGVDLVGLRYVTRIHQFGRRLKDTDCLGWLVEIQMEHQTQWAEQPAITSPLRARNRSAYKHRSKRWLECGGGSAGVDTADRSAGSSAELNSEDQRRLEKARRRTKKLNPMKRRLRHLVFRLALPHVALISISILYLIFGAATYAYLDRQYHASTHGELERSIDRAKSRFVDEMAINKRNETASVITFDNYMHYLNDVYKEHECYLQQHDDDQTFSGNLFMILTALTSIGYGEAAPCHSMGRGFMMGYIALGLPLMLVTIADSAKFASEVLLWLYLSYRRLYTRYFEQKLRDTKTKKLRQRKSVVEIVAQHAEMLARAQFGDDWVNSGIPPTATKEEIAEFIWQNLEKTEFVEVPVLLVLGVIVSYAGLGALMFHYTEGWTVTESLYFCIVSILTIGFGDFVPHNSSYITLATIYVLIGLVITTMGVDLVGLRYVTRIHQFGRRLKDTDCLGWLVEIQMRRKKREAMTALIRTLTALRFMKLDGTPNPVGRAKEERPDKVHNFRAIDTDAYSILLTWEPSPSYNQNEVEYIISYRPKSKSIIQRNVTLPAEQMSKISPRKLSCNDGLEPFQELKTSRTQHEVTGLRSCTLYQFIIRAKYVGGMERSKVSSLLHYTEPETVPQRLRVDLLDDSTLYVKWNPPYRNKCETKKYSIYFTDQGNSPYDQWQRLPLADEAHEAVLSYLKPHTFYTLCVAAVHNAGLAMISRQIAIKTSPKKRSTLDGWQFARMLNEVMEQVDRECEVRSTSKRSPGSRKLSKQHDTILEEDEDSQGERKSI